MTGTLLGPARRPLLALVALLVLAAVAVAALLADRPPPPAPATAPAHEFSAERALAPLRQIAAEPRPQGSPASDRARDHLAAALRQAGFSVRIERAVGVFGLQGHGAAGRVDNIVATLPGRDPTGTVLLAAHYDSVAGGPGASDDGAAVAAMLESVRALRDDVPLRNDLVLLITDGEENGLLGASAFARAHPEGPQPTVVLNWEARGVSGPSLMFETSPHNAALVRLFATAAPHPRGDSSMVELYRLLPNNTDFTVLAAAGLTGMNFAYIGDAARYHTPGDDIAHLDRASLQHHGSTMLGLTRALGNHDLPALEADHDATYFPVFGAMVVHSTALVWPLALLAAAALAVLVVLARRRRLLSLPRLLAGAGWALLALGTAAALAQGLWQVLLAQRPDYAETPFLYRPQCYELAVAALTAVAVLGWYLPLRRRVGPAALATGAVAWLAVLGVLTAWWAPGAAHLFVLPALGWALGGLLAVSPRRTRPWWSVLVISAGAVPAAVLLVPLAVGILGGTGLAFGGAAAVVLGLVALTLLPLADLGLAPLTEPRRRLRASLLPAAGAALAVALTAAGLVVDRADAAHPRRTDLVYLVDADTGRTSWVSRDVRPPPWTRQYVLERAPGPQRALGLADGPVWLGPAPASRAPAPELTLRSRRGDTLDLHVASPRRASTVVLRFDQRVGEFTVTAPGLAPARLGVPGTRPGRWPTELRLHDLPAGGVDISLRVGHRGPLRVVVADLSHGLGAVRGFTPRPPGLEPPPRPDSDAVVVSRTVQF